jgi:uncharacterized protein YpmS
MDMSPADADRRLVHRFLAVIAVLLAIIVVQLSGWVGPGQRQVQAQIPDSGLQRRQLLDAQDRTNQLLEDILHHLQTQSVKVRVVSTDKESRSESHPAPAPLPPPK